jgi:polyhydroxyalkanoate depolymerase
MLYLAYQTHADMIAPMRAFAAAAGLGLARIAGDNTVLRNLTAAYEIISRAGLTHKRPAFGIEKVKVGNRDVRVVEEVVHATAFGTLLRFRKDIDQAQPRVLLLAPLSGHFATLLRGTVQTMLPEFDVHITDWHNARDVPLDEGGFGFDDYIAHVIAFLEAMGPPAHLVAVCQPCVAALVVAAIMAEDDNPAQPRSMTLMAGPVDTRINPTKVNELANSRPISWFEQNLIARVPFRFGGSCRRVYPGFVQLAAFMSMNIERHVKAHRELYDHIVNGDSVRAEAARHFYDEYFAVLDLTAEFYLETVRLVFQEHALPRRVMTWRGRKVDLSAIRRTMLLTVEGEKDDICAIGQTVAAHDLCVGLKPFLKCHHMQAGAGHYGVFSGRRWESQVYPLVRNAILASN